jgi:CheY-like chemotaxis protein
MHLSDLQSVAKLADVPVMTSDEDTAMALMDPQQFSSIAEAVDTKTLFNLLHRQEYSPLAIVQFINVDGGDDAFVRVYFRCNDSCGETTANRVTSTPADQRCMKPRFLIADRDPAIREQARRVLINRGHEAHVAADGLQCLAQLRQMAPTVLVLDPKIPWGGGDGVLAWLHDESPLSHVKVFLVDEDDCGWIGREFANQIAGHLHRPRNTQQLVHFVNQLLLESNDRDLVPQA